MSLLFEFKLLMVNSNFDRFFVPGAIVFAGLIVALAVLYNGGFFSKGVAGGGKEAAVGAGAGDLAGKSPALGNPEAPVTIVEFSDFQCPFCNRFFREAGKQIIDKYVKTGKARFVYRHFAFLGPESGWAAEAANCANDQDKFWQYHDYLFNYIWDNYFAKGKSGENVGAFSKDNLKKFAVELGFDTAKFNSCLDSGKYADAVAKETAEGRTAGVNGTPATFVNGKLISGAVPFSQFEAAVEEALGAK